MLDSASRIVCTTSVPPAILRPHRCYIQVADHIAVGTHELGYASENLINGYENLI